MICTAGQPGGAPSTDACQYQSRRLKGVNTVGERQTGKVKWFDNSKGYGFITLTDGQDVFVHYRSIRGDGFKTLAQGQDVSFELNQTDKGLQASDVEKLLG